MLYKQGMCVDMSHLHITDGQSVLILPFAYKTVYQEKSNSSFENSGLFSTLCLNNKA